jgi:hypothetical protein
VTATPPAAAVAGRVLAGWWRQLAPLAPKGLWVGPLLVHRLEALARVDRPAAADPFQRLVLEAVELAGGRRDDLTRRLHLGDAFVRTALSDLHAAGLLRQAGDTWSLTDAGRQARAAGDYARAVLERRLFHFLDAPPPGEPHYLPLSLSAGLNGPPGDPATFDTAHLRRAAARPDDWKRRHGFPVEVREVFDLADTGPDAPPRWRRVVLDRPLRFLAVVALVAGGGGERVRGYVGKPDGGALGIGEPAFELPNDGAAFPELLTDPDADAWRSAWRAWCQARHPPAGAEDAPLERVGHLLRVRLAPAALAQLQPPRGELARGEGWVTAGAGRVQCAAQLELTAIEG